MHHVKHAPPADVASPMGVPAYSELVRYTLAGLAAALLLGLLLDHWHLQDSGVGSWAVRVLSGEGESLFEGYFAARRRLLGKAPSIAEAYGWGKISGAVAPWFIDAGSRLLGVDVSGASGFYIPWLYAMCDQIGATVSGLVFIRRHTGSLSVALQSWATEPVMLTSLIIIPVSAMVPLSSRLLGLQPDNQVLTALETGLANLSWLPPLVGFYLERRSPQDPPAGGRT